MDESAVAAICAVPPELQGGDAERFFDLIIEMYGEGLASFDELVPQIEQREPGLVNPATQFSDNLRTQGLDQRWPDIAQMLVSEGGTGSALVTLRDQYAAGGGAAEAGGDGAADWESFRAQNADFWAGWNGSDWATWRAAFTERVPTELTADSERQLSYLDTLDPAGQLTYLRDTLNFTINQEALDYYQTAAETSPADEDSQPATEAEAEAEAVAEETHLEAEAEEVATEIADKLADDPEMAEIMAEFSPEELTELLTEALGSG